MRFQLARGQLHRAVLHMTDLRPAYFRAMDILSFALLVGIRAFFLGREGIFPWQNNDGVGYVELARQLEQGAALSSVPDLTSTFMPISLFRLPGYSFIITAAQSIAGNSWPLMIVAVQLTISTLANFYLYRVCRRITGSPLLALVLSLIFTLSVQIAFERYILTDALFSAISTAVMCRIASILWTGAAVRWGEAITLGISLSLMVLLRDTGIVLVALAFPLFATIVLPMLPWRQSAKQLSLLMLPSILVLLGIMGWNYIRIGQPLLTTGSQTAMIWTLSQVEKNGTPVFTGDSLIDRVARKNLKSYEFSDTARINQELFSDYAMTAPEIAKLAKTRFIQAWWDQPRSMWHHTVQNLEFAKLSMLSQYLYSSLTAPWNDIYSAWIQKIFVYSTISLPLYLFLAAAFIPSARRDALIVSLLCTFIWGGIGAVAIIHLEQRYLLFAIAPACLNIAWLVGLIKRWIRSLAAGGIGKIYNHVCNVFFRGGVRMNTIFVTVSMTGLLASILAGMRYLIADLGPTGGASYLITRPITSARDAATIVTILLAIYAIISTIRRTPPKKAG